MNIFVQDKKSSFSMQQTRSIFLQNTNLDKLLAVQRSEGQLHLQQRLQ